MIEILLEDFLTKIHTKNFSNPKQICKELGRLLIRDQLTYDQYSYCSSKIFSSDLDLFTFLKDNALDRDIHVESLRKEVLDVMCEYLQVAKIHLTNYLSHIRNSALLVFKKDQSVVVKETALKLVVKLLQNYEANLLEHAIQVESLTQLLLEEIEIYNPEPSVRSRIWQILGELIQKFYPKMELFISKIKELNLHAIKEMTRYKTKLDLVTPKGLLKATRALLQVTAYADEEIKLLFTYARGSSKKIDDLKTYDIVVECLHMLKENSRRFDTLTIGMEKIIIEDTLVTMRMQNQNIDQIGSDFLESFCENISKREGVVSSDLIHYFISKVSAIVKKNDDPVEVVVFLRCFGHLAGLIKRCLGDEDLNKHFILLFKISQKIVLDDITDSYKNISGDSIQPENLKNILYRQKQLSSTIKAFALIVRELDTLSEYDAKYMIGLLMIGVNNHKLFFEGEKKNLYAAIAQLIDSMSVYASIYRFWIKKVVSEMLIEFVRLPTSEIDTYDQDIMSIQNSSRFIVRLMRQDNWSEEVKQYFGKSFLTGIIDFLRSSEFGYRETQDQQDKLFIPYNNEDQHLTLRLALIFEEVQRSTVLDEIIPDHFEDLLDLVSKGLTRYIRTTSVQKLFKSLLSIAERLSQTLLQDKPENIDTLTAGLDIQFSMLKELRDDSLLDTLRCLMSTPTEVMRRSKKAIEIFERSLLITLKMTGPQSIFMVDHAVTNLERVLLKGKIYMQPSKNKFLQEILPYFAYLLGTDLEGAIDLNYTVTVQESKLERQEVLNKCITFLGGLGSDLRYIVKQSQQESQLDQREADILKVSIPLDNHMISLNLNHIIKRASQLALENPNEFLQSAACELFHGCVVMIIGKCSQGSEASEDLADALESALPSIVKLSLSSTPFSALFKDLLLQIARWLPLNKEKDNSLVASFISGLLELAGCGDKPEVRSLCLEALEHFLTSICKFRDDRQSQTNNFNILFRKIDSLMLHTDPFKQITGIMSLKLIISVVSNMVGIKKVLFFDLVYYFILYLRKHETSSELNQISESEILCEDVYTSLESLIKTKVRDLDTVENESAKYSTFDELFSTLQKSIFSPNHSLRQYSLRLWILMRTGLSQLVSAKVLEDSRYFLADMPTIDNGEDRTVALKSIVARCETLATLIENNVIQERHLREDQAAWSEIESNAMILSQTVSSAICEEVTRSCILSFANLAGLIRQQERYMLLFAIKKSEFVLSLLAAAFKSKSLKSVETCKRVLSVLEVNIPIAVREFVNSHEYRFDNPNDLIFKVDSKIVPKNLENFFDKILMFLDPIPLVSKLLDDVFIGNILNCIKNIERTSKPEAIGRAKVLIKFILNTESLEDRQIATLINPSNSESEYFSGIVKTHLSKQNDENSRSVIEFTFSESKQDQNMFAPIIDMLYQFIDVSKSTDAFFNSFNKLYDAEFITTHGLYTTNLINLAVLFMQERKLLSDDKCIALLEQSLTKNNRESLGLLGLEFLSQYARSTSRHQFSLIYRRIKPSLLDYTRDMLPVIFDEKAEICREMGTVKDIALKVLSLIEHSGLLEPIQLIFPLIQNRKAFRSELASVIEAIVIRRESTELNENVDFCLSILKDDSISETFEFNIRFNIIDRVLLPLLECSPSDLLDKMFVRIYSDLVRILEPRVEDHWPATKKVLKAAEKSCAFKIIELLFRKIDSCVIIEKDHRHIIGEFTQNIEITKKLIKLCSAPKEHQTRKAFEDSVRTSIDTDIPGKFSIAAALILDYYCAAYNCLLSVLLNSQIEESVFCSHLLTSKPSSGDYLLSNIIDDDMFFSFSASTHFKLENLMAYYRTEPTENTQSEVGLRQLVGKLTADSIYTETLSRGRLAPTRRYSTDNQRQKPLDLIDWIKKDFRSRNQIDHQVIENSDLKLEMDSINSITHTMRSFVRLVDFLNQNFKATQSQSMPKWIIMIEKLFQDHTSEQQRVFLLKLIINRPDIFKPYRGQFNEYLLQYMAGSHEHGSGLHYFLRHVCTTLIAWNTDDGSVALESISGNPRLRQLSCTALSNISKKLADKSRPIFMLNLDVFKSLCHLLRKTAVIDESVVLPMLVFSGKKEKDCNSSHEYKLSSGDILWRLTGIGILETVITEDIEVRKSESAPTTGSGGGSRDNIISQMINSTQPSAIIPRSAEYSQFSSSTSFGIKIKAQTLTLSDNLVFAILINMGVERKDICSASFRLAGIYLNNLSSRLPHSLKLYEDFKSKVMGQIEILLNNKLTSMEVNICELCKVYPQVFLERVIYIQINEFIIKTSGETRAYIFNALQTVVRRCLEKPREMQRAANDLILTISKSSVQILRDSDTNNIIEFLLLITEMAKLNNRNMIEFLEQSMDKISEIMLKLLKPDDLLLFFNFVKVIHNSYQSNETFLRSAKRHMMLGLSHKSESVRGKVIEWLKKESKVLDSKDRLLQFILEDLYNPEYEHLWLTTSAQLIMSLTSNSAHIRQKVFDKSLPGYVSSGMFTLSTKPDLNKLFSKPMILLSLTSASKADPKQSANRSFQRMIIQAEGNEHILKARSRYFDKQSNERNSMATDQPIKVQYPSQDKNGSILNDDNHSRSTTQTQEWSIHRANMGSFWQQNEICFNQIMQTSHHKLRKVDQSGIKSINKPSTRTMTQRCISRLSSHVKKTIRQYNQGELPDIQICYADIITPLTVIAANDTKMAQLIFVPIFLEFYQKSTNANRFLILKQLLRIIDQSNSNYQVVNTAQAILYEMSLNFPSLEIDPETITKTGTGSLSYAGAALLLEDMLARLQRDLARDVQIAKPTHRVLSSSQYIARRNYKDDPKFELEINDSRSTKLVLNLVDIYKQINDNDVLTGLHRLIHSGNQAAYHAYDLKMGNETLRSLKNLKELVESNDQSDKLGEDEALAEYLAQEFRESQYILGKWSDLVNGIHSDNHYLELNCIETDENGAKFLVDAAAMRKTDRQYLFRGMLNQEDQRGVFIFMINDVLLRNPAQKILLEKDHPYEMALLSVIMNEFDTAKYYLEKFRDRFFKIWSGVKDFSSLQAKTEVICDFLLQHELKEFLSNTRHFNVEGMVDSPDLENFCQTLDRWLKIDSSATLENFNYLSDSYHSRNLFTEIMKHRYREEYSEDRYNRHRVKIALDYASGLLKMGHVDIAERTLSQICSVKEKYLPDDISLTCDMTILIVQCKLEAVQRDVNSVCRRFDESNIDIRFITSRFTEINSITEAMIEKNTSKMNFTEDLRMNLLRLNAKTKQIAAIKDYVGPSQTSSDIEINYLRMVAEALSIVKDKLAGFKHLEVMDSLMDDHPSNMQTMDIKAQLIEKKCDIVESFLRWFKAKAEDAEINLKELATREPNKEITQMAHNLMVSVLDVCRLGKSSHARLLFLLEIVTEFRQELGSEFVKEFSNVPCWIFLKWLPQLFSYLNDDSNAFYLPIMKRLLEMYPEPMIYALSVATDEAGWFPQQSSNRDILRSMLNNKCDNCSTHLKFIRSMECLLNPDQRLRSWLESLYLNVEYPSRVAKIVEQMTADVFTTEDSLLGQGFGYSNKKFISEMSNVMESQFGSNFMKISKMDPNQIRNACAMLIESTMNNCKSSIHAKGDYKPELSSFSSWLAEYDIKNYTQQDMRLEIPGQYKGDYQPQPELHVKISHFIPEVMVIQSLRKPKRLTMLGTDEKIYHCLVKGGEDLRLDQRIEQLFSIMNEMFASDVECSKREFKIGTFNVIPVKKNLGIMEWVKNTMPMTAVIEKEMPKEENLLINNAKKRRVSLLRELGKSLDFKEQHVKLLSASREVVVKDFTKQCELFKSNCLKIAVKKRVQNAEQYVKLRKQFIRNYAVLSLGLYILGVGDRHLDNFLFDYVNGQIFSIDFGCSFGCGVGLHIPELMPFRLTQNFQELMYPLGVEGLFRNSMIFAMKAMRIQKYVIIDTCEVFIRDLLIDWVKHAKTKSMLKKINMEAVEPREMNTSQEQANLFARDKMCVVRQKLIGFNPVGVMLGEMELTFHKNMPYYSQLTATVKGDTHRPRYSIGENKLSLNDQIDCLIDLASDPEVLGRTWTGWAPYA